MAKRKAPTTTSELDMAVHKMTETIANYPNRSEKTSWNRKMDNMVKLLAKLRPIEEEILNLQAQKQPIFDAVQALRETMVTECIHPYQYIAIMEEHAVCKFCNAKIKKPNA